MEPVTLRTGRLELSAPRQDDAAAVFAACQDESIRQNTPAPTPFTHQDADALIAKAHESWHTGEHLVWAVRERDVFCGIVGLYRVDGRGSGELGYWLAPTARGRGILTEAATAVLAWGFSDDGAALHRIEWHAVAGNTPSARVARTLGFRFEGVRRAALHGMTGRVDGWAAALLRTDDRSPARWPVLAD